MKSSLQPLRLRISPPNFSWSRIHCGVVFAALFLPAARAQIPVFADGFENGVVANSDTTTGFWPTSGNLSNSSLTETGGALVFTAGVDGTTQGNLNPYLSSATSREFNFFRRKLRFAGTLSLTGAAPGNLCTTAVSLLGAAGKSYDLEDVVTIRFRGDNVVFAGSKQEKPAASPVAFAAVNNVTLPGTITGFEFTIDATTYELKVFHAGGNGSTTFTGPHGLIAAQWGLDGDSALGLESGRGNGSPGNSVAAFSQLTVSRLDTPAATVFEDNFVTGPLADSDTETGVWTTTIAQTSTAVKAEGKLTLTARQAAAGAIIATQGTATAARFNFFDQPLRFTANVLTSGTVDNIFKRPSHLALASTASNGDAAPDLIYVGLRETGLLLGTKVNAPGSPPESTPSSSIKRLIGTNDGIYDYDYAVLGATMDHLEFTLDAKRFQLTSTETGKASGRARFSGLHGLNRADWGAAGDSALLLEAVRNGSAGADTTAISAWDSVQVENSSEHFLAEPYWDFKVTYAINTATPPATTTVPFTVWVPITEPTIRGVIFLGAGDGDDFRYLVHDPVAQETARALGFALIGYRNPDAAGTVRRGNMNLYSKNATLIKNAVQIVLDAAAVASGKPEIKNAPLMSTGFSAGGFDATFLAAYWPERVIGYVSNHGACKISNDGGSTSIATALLTNTVKKIPGLFISGGADTNGTANSQIIKSNFTTWRSAGAQAAVAVDWRMQHTLARDITTGLNNQGWEAGMAWLAEVATLRYPRPQLPPASPAGWSFTDLADASGWLGDTASFSASTTPSVTSPFTPIAPFASYSGTATAASWLPDEAMARMYQAFTSTDLVNTRIAAPLQTPLRIVSPAQYGDAVPIGPPVSIEVDPREFDDLRTITQMAFYDNATLLGTDTTPLGWSLSFTPTTAGLHTLSVVATGSDGVKSAAFRILHVIPGNFPPVVSSSQSLSLAANGSAIGNVSASDPEGETITYAVLNPPLKGLLTLNPSTGAYTYRPARGFVGSDSFVLQAVAGSTSTSVTVGASVTPLADGDLDGLPDAWETANGVTDPAADPDGDGQTNRQEYLAGTDPKQAASVFQATGLDIPAAPASSQITWATSGGVRYRVQYTDDLATGFTDLVRPASVEINAAAEGVAGSATFTDNYTLTPPLGNRRFYRVRIVSGSE